MFGLGGIRPPSLLLPTLFTNLLDGQIVLPQFVNAQNFYFNHVSHINVLADVGHIGIRDLGNVHQAGVFLRQFYKSAEVRDPGYFSFDFRTYLNRQLFHPLVYNFIGCFTLFNHA